MSKEKFDFQADVHRVLDLVIHSLYSNKEIFLRELVSNASDALDKLRFAALSESGLYGDDADLKIRIDVDKNARTLTIADNGIGMTRQEVIEHLGTIAKSGTREFLAQLQADASAKSDVHLIGQFGVGFYSAFIVADKVTVRTRKAGTQDDAIEWISDGAREFTIETIDQPLRGTEVTLHLREGMDEFLEPERLRFIIKKYSDYVSWPILMPKEAIKDEESKSAEKNKNTAEYEAVNRATAMWTLPKNQITDEQYKEFYKHVAHDFDEPLTWMHNHVEGKQNYISLLYIPKHAPFDLWQPENKHGLKLYVQRVFIMDDVEQFLPRYMRFVRGIIDSSDLPLNISREILQDNKMIETIRAANTKKILSTLEKMAQDEPEKYQTFWNEFGQLLKEGVIEDVSSRPQLANLLRFASTHSAEAVQNISLADYMSRMRPEQDKIYYLTAENYNAAKSSPHLEIFRSKGIEVLLLTDRIDEWLVTHLYEYEGKSLQSVTKGNLDLGKLEDEETKEEQEKVESEFASMLDHAKKVLAERVKEVRLTHRLTQSPACVVGDEYELGRQMQRLLRAAGQQIPTSKPILELNAKHPIVTRLKEETDDQRFSDWLHILLDQAILAEGGQLDNSAAFVARLNKMLLEVTN